MKKILLVLASMFVLIVLMPSKVSAVECCPDGYTFDNINDNCQKWTNSIGGGYYEYIDWGCPTGEICDENLCVLPEEFTVKENAKGNFPTCDTSSGKGINTAIGCIPLEDSNALIGFILKWAIGVGGGIAFLLIVVASFQIMTSSGNPDKIKAGQELLTSAIAGLLLLIFSVFVLRVIGIDILKLPGFGQ